MKISRKGSIRTWRLAVACLGALTIVVAGCGKPGGDTTAAGGPTVGSNAPASTADTVKTIQQRIAADKDLQGKSITVKEESGTISLEGTVDTQTQKDQAEKIVYDVQKELKQQTGVMNNLMIQENGASATASGAKKNGGN